MSHEVLSEEKIREAFEQYQNGTDIKEIASKNFVDIRSLYRYFARRGLKKCRRKGVSDKRAKM